MTTRTEIFFVRETTDNRDGGKFKVYVSSTMTVTVIPGYDCTTPEQAVEEYIARQQAKIKLAKALICS